MKAKESKKQFSSPEALWKVLGTLFKEELGKRKRITTDENTDLYVAECLYRIGVCLRDSDQCLDAIEQFERALSIHKQFQRTKERNKCIASCLYYISICKYLLNPSNSPNLFP